MTDSGRAVFEIGLQRLRRLLVKNSRGIWLTDPIQELVTWKSIYPVLPDRLREENGFVPYNRDPRVLKRFEPEYPLSEMALGISGTVWACADIDTLGNVIDAWGVKYPSDRLLIASLTALRQFKFVPCKLKGTLARSTVSLPFRFVIRK